MPWEKSNTPYLVSFIYCVLEQNYLALQEPIVSFLVTEQINVAQRKRKSFTLAWIDGLFVIISYDKYPNSLTHF